MIGMPGNRKLLGRLLSLSQVGAEMVAPVVVGLWLDGRLAFFPWCTVAGAMLGLVGGLIHLVILSKPQPGEDIPEGNSKP
ncbi:MAG: AtpZ/AtpI family protein [Planctomycetia bacterium]|nr:AtpZ/AtpI family protein [Planctomycetia bacterium]